MKESTANTKLQRKAAKGIPAGPSPTAKPATEELQLHQVSSAQAAIGRAETHQQRIDALVKRAHKVSGTRTNEVANRIVLQVASALVWPRLKTNDTEELLAQTVAAIAEMAPQSTTEAMLASQMIAVHEAALMFLSRGTESQYQDAIEANVLRAARLMRVFGEQLEAMQKLKGKTGQQKVTVEHVHVHQGGQAIVGNVTSTGAREGAGHDVEKR